MPAKLDLSSTLPCAVTIAPNSPPKLIKNRHDNDTALRSSPSPDSREAPNHRYSLR